MADQDEQLPEYEIIGDVTITQCSPNYTWAVFVDGKKVMSGNCYRPKKAWRKVRRKVKRVQRDLAMGCTIDRYS